MTAPFTRGPAGVVGVAQAGRVRPRGWTPLDLPSVHGWWDPSLNGQNEVKDWLGGASLISGTVAGGGNDTDDPDFLPFTGSPYVWLPGTVGNWLSAPHRAGQIPTTGDFEIVGRVRPSLTIEGGLFGKLGAVGSAGLQVNLSPTSLVLYLGTVGSTYGVAAAAHGFAAGVTVWFRITWTSSTNTAAFFKAADQQTVPSSWTALGSSTIANPAIVENVANPNMGYAFPGSIHYFAIRRAGAPIIEFDAARCGQSGYSYGPDAWAVTRTTSGKKSVVIRNKSVVLMGGGQVISSPGGAFAPNLNSDFSVFTAWRVWPNHQASAYIAPALAYSSSPNKGFLIYDHPTTQGGTYVEFYSGGVWSGGGSPADVASNRVGAVTVYGVTRTGATFAAWRNGQASAPSAIGNDAEPNRVSINAMAGGGAMEGEFLGLVSTRAAMSTSDATKLQAFFAANGN